MTVLKSVVKDGKIELEAPTDWPEGTEVRIEPVAGSIGIRDEDWPDTPEGIARLLDSMDRVEPLDMTAEEEANWAAARAAQRDWEKARFVEHADSLAKDWE
jgi:hypothetical protein